MDAAHIRGLLRRWAEGERAALDALLALLHDELRHQARRHLRGERRDHRLRPTELELLDEREARVVGLHYCGGLSQLEIARHLGTHVNTTWRDLRFAQGWIDQRPLVAS